jgi:type I restriction enzyme S subunit
MSFPRYPKYKDSGVEWLGQVPEHWEAIRYKNVFEEKFVEAGGSLPLGSISFGRVVFKSDDFFNEATKATYQEVLAGEFLINPINLNYDLKSLRTALSEINTCVSPAYIVLKAKRAPDKNYLKHQLHAFDLFHMKTLGAGVRQTITFEDIGTCQTYLPPLPEQTRIAAFLDQETAKIDTLVAEQERLMELLKEKRQSAISHAVTKGLNPKAPMMPSGVEWLGDVPTHWEVKPVKFVARIGNGSTPSRENLDYWTDGNYPWLNSSVVNQDSVVEAEEFVTSLALEECHLPKIIPPAVLIGITGQGRTRGMATILLIEATINQHVAYLKTIPAQADVFFLRRVFDMAYSYLRRDSEAGSTKGAITCEQIGNFKIAVPPLDEQAKIVSFTQEMSDKFDTLATEAQRAIDLLQERRTAVISAAVTGQIDVRHN